MGELITLGPWGRGRIQESERDGKVIRLGTGLTKGSEARGTKELSLQEPKDCERGASEKRILAKSAVLGLIRAGSGSELCYSFSV